MPRRDAPQDGLIAARKRTRTVDRHVVAYQGKLEQVTPVSSIEAHPVGTALSAPNASTQIEFSNTPVTARAVNQSSNMFEDCASLIGRQLPVIYAVENYPYLAHAIS
jgi:hypothetical protein